ncbi:MAG TPA: hypothetical protein VEL31_26325, partial [Ktedonobacteraceae bacterium]|nr:hypothetical protein [Ktedonobacteraceae bacterium]
TSTFYMAHSHLQNKEYDAAIKQFRTLEERTSEMIKSKPLAEIVEKDFIGHITLGEMYALALWGQAYIWADCDIRLLEALELANNACEQANKIDIKDLQFPARYAHCKGWILYKLDAAGESAPAPYTGIDDALRFLREAIAMEVRAEYYLHLALASGNKLSSLRYKSDIQRHMISIQEYCLRARNLSSNDVHINQQGDDLLKRLSPSIEVSLTLPATGRKNGVHKN